MVILSVSPKAYSQRSCPICHTPSVKGHFYKISPWSLEEVDFLIPYQLLKRNSLLTNLVVFGGTKNH